MAEPAPVDKAEPSTPVILPSHPPEPIHIEEAVPPAPPRKLAEGEEKFASADYRGAILNFEAFLKENPAHLEAARIAFHLGIAYGLASPDTEFQRKALEQFRKVIRLYPTSAYRIESEYVLKLQGDIDKLRAESEEKDEKLKRLAEELERIKKIDIEKRPSRPPD